MKLSFYFVRQAIKNSYRLLLFELARHNSAFVSIIPFRPLEAVIYLTENCNSKCITCNFWKQKSQGELTTEELTNVMAQLKQLGVTYLCLTGGEPLLRPDLPQIIEEAHRQRFNKIQLITNALLLKRDVLENLLDRGLNKVTISLNGTQETHDSTRGVSGSYERCLQALEILSELRRSRKYHLDVTVNMIVMRQNLDEILQVASLCQQAGVALGLTPVDDRGYYVVKNLSDLKINDQKKLDKVTSELHRLARICPNLLNETHTSLEYLRRYFIDPVRKDIPCYLGYLITFIGAHGEVRSGCDVLPPIGNIRDNPLKDIVNSTEYKARLAAMFAKKCPGCICGYGFNLYAHVPTIWEELLWRIRIRGPKTPVSLETHKNANNDRNTINVSTSPVTHRGMEHDQHS